MWLGTREDHGVSEEDLNWTEIKQHASLIKIFAENELRKYGKEPHKWSGQLSQPALVILHQHAIQGDITAVQQSVW